MERAFSLGFVFRIHIYTHSRNTPRPMIDLLCMRADRRLNGKWSCLFPCCRLCHTKRVLLWAKMFSRRSAVLLPVSRVWRLSVQTAAAIKQFSPTDNLTGSPPVKSYPFLSSVERIDRIRLCYNAVFIKDTTHSVCNANTIIRIKFETSRR